MKICFLADGYSIHTQRWIKYFAEKNNHQIFLITFRPVQNNNINNVRLFLLKEFHSSIWGISYILNILLNSIKIIKIMKEINPDVLHAHFVTDYGLLGALSGFHPLVVTAWGSDILVYPKKKRKHRYIVRYVLGKSDLITSDSEKVKQSMISLNRNAEKSHIIQWGINLNKFNPAIKTDIRAKLGLGNTLIIISMRSFNQLYNIDIIIRSIPHILNKFPDVKFILKNAYGEMESELRDLAIKLGVIESIIFIGEVDYDAIPAYLKTSDIFISIPSSDSTSISLLEAMACGLPVIVSDLPANKEWIIDGWNGFIVPVRDHIALAEKIVELLKDKEKRELFGNRNYELVREKADHEKHMARMEELYYSLIKKTNL